MTVLLSRREVLAGGAALLLPAAGCQALGQPRPQVRKRIYLAPDDHTDYLWSADEDTYRRVFLETLDFYLDLADATAAAPRDYQSRWNCDGWLWLQTYERHRPPERFLRLIERIRSGHVTVPLNALVLCLGAAPAEAVLRGMYYAGRIERRHGLRFPMAVAVENQTLPYGLGALWAGAGARYTWRGICGCATRVDDPGDRPHEVYWWVGPDGSRLLTKWNSMLHDYHSMGGYAEARDPAAVVEYVSSDPAFLARYPYHVVGAFGRGGDDLQTLARDLPDLARALTDARRQVVVSNQVDFFEDLERTHGAALPSVSESYGNEWDTLCASMAETTARVKRAVEDLRAAEALAALVSLHDPGFMARHDAGREDAHAALGLYWEHDWTGDGPVGRAARARWQDGLAGALEGYVRALLDAAAGALGAAIRRRGSATRFYVFNPLAWTRTDLADLPWDGGPDVHVVDLSSGAPCAAQVVTLGGRRHLRVLARELPPVGYHVFEVREGRGSLPPGGVVARRGLLENTFYRVLVAPNGALTSLVDRRRGDRELARPLQGYALNDLGPSRGVLALENVGPVSATVVARAAGPVRHETRVTLARDLDRVTLQNHLREGFDTLHAWRFAFALESPALWHEEVGAIVLARTTADGGHYAARRARYDWLTLNHFADLSSAGAGVTLSNADCCFVRRGRSTPSALDTRTPLLAVLAGAQVDGPELGIPAQGGARSFLQRFALRAHAGFDPAAAMRFALEHQNPLVAAPVTGGDALPETELSLLRVDPGEVLLWALKPAEDGIRHGLVARVWNLSPRALPCVITPHPGRFPLARALRTTHLETPLETLPVTGQRLQRTLAPWGLATFALQTTPP